ncbi:hypothetical protein MBSPM3_v1c3860 [Maize bushy stunt phytoplasma]|uniref:Uncharacterized protein n=1 Tax=Maize bushy stunt phytoplasma TaxID=202462 RepID=A0ABN4RYT4_9MOLU|nr:hypothetical protein [Maize bushy stunt phytoplasma]AOF54893.1 hypothetical protein MBSPM3_v1c3860 [Maize bushy stunt phytoplasma]
MFGSYVVLEASKKYQEADTASFSKTYNDNSTKFYKENSYSASLVNEEAKKSYDAKLEKHNEDQKALKEKQEVTKKYVFLFVEFFFVLALVGFNGHFCYSKAKSFK